jgi:hypothetical protein
MTAEALRDELVDSLAEFVSSQWAQLGVSFARPELAEQRAADPEALLLFTLYLGRHEPRLFDETLDWLALNEPLVSVYRLRGLCVEPADRAVVDAALDWAAAQRRRGRNRPADVADAERLDPLFAWLDLPTREPDPHFARHGWARPVLNRSAKSQPIPIKAPISFAFRLRRLLGIGVRAEIVRALLTIRAPRVSSKVIAASTGFAQRNVREGLSQLYDAGVLAVVEVSDDRHYAIRHEHWSALLLLDHPRDLPFHYDWIPAFRALAKILRWLDEPGLDELSEYMRASQARTLLDTIAMDLRYVGVPPHLHEGVGSDQWDDFVNVARVAVGHLIAGH